MVLMRSRVLGSASHAFIWALSESTMGLGVLAGRKMPNQVETLKGFSSGMVSLIGTRPGVRAGQSHLPK